MMVGIHPLWWSDGAFMAGIQLLFYPVTLVSWWWWFGGEDDSDIVVFDGGIVIVVVDVVDADSKNGDVIGWTVYGTFSKSPPLPCLGILAPPDARFHQNSSSLWRWWGWWQFRDSWLIGEGILVAVKHIWGELFPLLEVFTFLLFYLLNVSSPPSLWLWLPDALVCRTRDSWRIKQGTRCKDCNQRCVASKTANFSKM